MDGPTLTHQLEFSRDRLMELVEKDPHLSSKLLFDQIPIETPSRILHSGEAWIWFSVEEGLPPWQRQDQAAGSGRLRFASLHGRIFPGRLVCINNNDNLYKGWLIVQMELSHFVVSDLHLGAYAKKNDISFESRTTYKKILSKLEDKMPPMVPLSLLAAVKLFNWRPGPGSISDDFANANKLWVEAQW